MLTLVLEEQFSDRTHLDKKKNAEEETFTFHKIENQEEHFTKLRNRSRRKVHNSQN